MCPQRNNDVGALFQREALHFTESTDEVFMARLGVPATLLILVALGCEGYDPGDYPVAPPRLEQPLVSAAELVTLLEQPNVRLIDARSTPEYLAGHIPGAISASFPEGQSTSNGVPVSYGGGVDFFLDVNRTIPFQDGDADHIQAAVRALGIRNDSRVVIYDAGAHFHATRFAYTLEKHGFRNLHVLDGGLMAWTAGGGDLSTEVTPIEPGNFSAAPADERLIATTYDVLAALNDPNVAVVSSLSPDWHFGQYLAYSEPGHIPSAVPIPMFYFFDGNGAWRSAAQIRALLDVSGISPEQEIITYCGGNPLSSCNYFTLRHVLGHERVRVYEEALVGWLDDPRDLETHTWQHPEMLRDSDWIHWWAGERIQSLLLDAPAQVLDVRPAESFGEGHIPWSVNIPAEDLAGTSPDEWALALGAAGLSTDREVVICDDEITPAMTSMFWLLEYLGHTRVSVCAEGLDGWTNRNYALSDQPAVVSEPDQPLHVGLHPSEFAIDVQADRRLSSIDGTPIHAAFPRRWIVASEQMPDHIDEVDTFSHVPWSLLGSSGRMRGAAATWELFEEQGVSFFEELIVTADTWEHATTVYFALRLLGLPMVRLYLPADAEL